MRDIYDLVQDEIFNNIDNTIKVESITAPSGGNQVVTFCNNKWIRVNQVVKDSLNREYKVISISQNGNVTLKLPTGVTSIAKREIFDIKEPKFIFGSKINANNEYNLRGKDNRTKLPLCWLVESINETEYNLKSSKERDVTLRFYLLDDNNPSQYLTSDYRLNVVTPMIALKDEIKRVIENNVLFELPNAYNTRTITRFGNENESGVFENIIDDNLSGVELSVTLPIYKSGKNCKC